MTLPRDVTTPLAWYVAVTVGVPLCRGSGEDSAFREHALTILVCAGILVAVRMSIRALG